MKKQALAARSSVAALILSICLAQGALFGCAHAQGANTATPGSAPAGSGDISGTVKSVKGPEAGVWVIAETTDTPTRYTKIVVTDDQGRFLVPDLPKGTYQVWVRGYGLVDSVKVQATPGATLELTALPAPTPAAAAQYYPPIYWFSLLRVPPANAFPTEQMKSQGEWLNTVKSGACQSCHALGTPGTRTISKRLGNFKTSADAWTVRLQAGSAQAFMARDITKLGGEALKLFGQWTDGIAAGELPFATPERPSGMSRNVVVTEWEWSDTTAYLHDEISTDRWDPTVNAKGKLYGSAEDSTDYMPILDPATHSDSEVKIPVRDPATPNVTARPHGFSPSWGPNAIWNSQTITHNPMMDEKGRIWMTSQIRAPENPDWCKAGSSHPSAKAFPIKQSNRNIAMYDPASEKFTLVSTCFPTHHLAFSRDHAQLFFSAGVVGPAVLGWLDVKKFEAGNDEIQSQRWTPFVVDTSGDGKRGDYVEPNEPVQPGKDKRIAVNEYAIAVSPTDGAIWGTVIGYPGSIVRTVLGPNPEETALSEIYEPPLPGYGPRGGDIDADGVYWVALSSGHVGSFDRRKCKVLNGPTALGKHCPEGWTLYQLPGPQIRGVEDGGSAEASYYVWVDWFNTYGLGKNVPIVMGNLNSSILAIV
ncbi:MAG TPA: carboxypeptidase-like regulatory domain-containing protein, partial [Bradyrhizobium sp.]|uniref:carboxypeptidase-like regulatory domain-containing protein n=1 Tax=Bradyrhizobium sp. TaxID=376 RepID=UPI002D7EEEAA